MTGPALIDGPGERNNASPCEIAGELLGFMDRCGFWKRHENDSAEVRVSEARKQIADF